MADDIDVSAELSAILGGGGEEKKDGEGGGAPDLSTLVLPSTDDIPAELRGKPVTEGLKAFAEMHKSLTQALQEKAQLVRTLEQAGAGGGTGTPAGGTPTTPTSAPELTVADVSVNAVVEMKLDQEIAKEPELAPYKTEIMALIQGVQDPRVRLNTQALTTAIAHIRGVHYKDLMQAQLAKLKGDPSTPITPDAGGVPPVPNPNKLDLSKAQQANAVAWLGAEGIKGILGGS